jgi:Family of unknown function (DUF6624)
VLRLVSVAVLATLLACGDDDAGGGGGGPSNPELRAELLQMMEDDQAEQTGQRTSDSDYTTRTDRLAEILDEHGWPGWDLVGEDGSTATWVIAQHADLDPELQQRALELLRTAAEDGQASKGDLAYLEDRVAVAAGEDQQYGTQIRCDPGGHPVAATPIAEEPNVDARRADAGLPPLDDYLAEMAAMCAPGGSMTVLTTPRNTE